MIGDGNIWFKEVRKHLAPACTGLIRLVSNGGVSHQENGRHGYGLDRHTADVRSGTVEFQSEFVVPTQQTDLAIVQYYRGSARRVLFWRRHSVVAHVDDKTTRYVFAWLR